MISFVTPTYNREKLVCETLDSIFSLSELYNNFEVILVDDASEDNTLALLNKRYHNELSQGILNIHSLKKNIGVTGAKNYGAKSSKGDWIVFLDSDDLLITSNYGRMLEELEKHNDADAVFFSCIDFNGTRIGQYFNNSKLTVDEYLDTGTKGEKLPVIKKSSFLENPYNTELRGFEGLTYLEMLLNNKTLYLNNLICRKYRQDNSDRLSLLSGRIKRSSQLSRGIYKKIMLLKKNQKPIPLSMLVKLPAYVLLSVVNKILYRS